MREYRVTIECKNSDPVGLTIFAKDREDAIKFVKRNHRMRFWQGEFVRIKGARRIKGPEVKSILDLKPPPVELWTSWPADETR